MIGIFGFTHIWDQYLLPLLAASLLALLPSVIAFIAMQSQFMNGLTSGAIKG